MQNQGKTNVRLPVSVIAAALALVMTIAWLVVRQRWLELCVGEALDFDFLRDGTTMILLTGILAGFLLRGERWARYLSTLGAVAGTDWLFLSVSSRSAASYLPMSVATILPACTFVAHALLLYTPSAATWFRAGRGATATYPRYWRLAWGIFLASLLANYLTYWNFTTYQGMVARSPSDGFFLFGLATVIAGFYLYCHLLARSKPDQSQPASATVVVDIFLANLIFLVSLLFPAKSLGYLALLVFPLQLLGALVVAVVIMRRQWAWISQGPDYLASYLLGLLLVMAPWSLVVKVAIDGIH